MSYELWPDFDSLSKKERKERILSEAVKKIAKKKKYKKTKKRRR